MMSCLCPEAVEEFAEFVFHEYRELPNNSVNTVLVGPFLMVRVFAFVAVVSSLCSVAEDDDIAGAVVVEVEDDEVVSSSTCEDGEVEVTASESNSIVASDSSHRYELLESKAKITQHIRRDRKEGLFIIAAE